MNAHSARVYVYIEILSAVLRSHIYKETFTSPTPHSKAVCDCAAEQIRKPIDLPVQNKAFWEKLTVIQIGKNIQIDDSELVGQIKFKQL
jgi:hypothetical protein